MIDRVVHLGFEVRVELTLQDGEQFSVQLTREQVDELELKEGQTVFVRPEGRQGVQRTDQAASGARTSRRGAVESPRTTATESSGSPTAQPGRERPYVTVDGETFISRTSGSLPPSDSQTVLARLRWQPASISPWQWHTAALPPPGTADGLPSPWSTSLAGVA